MMKPIRKAVIPAAGFGTRFFASYQIHSQRNDSYRR